MDPNNFEAYFEKGYSLYDLKKYEESISCFNKVIE